MYIYVCVKKTHELRKFLPFIVLHRKFRLHTITMMNRKRERTLQSPIPACHCHRLFFHSLYVSLHPRTHPYTRNNKMTQLLLCVKVCCRSRDTRLIRQHNHTNLHSISTTFRATFPLRRRCSDGLGCRAGDLLLEIKHALEGVHIVECGVHLGAVCAARSESLHRPMQEFVHNTSGHFLEHLALLG